MLSIIDKSNPVLLSTTQTIEQGYSELTAPWTIATQTTFQGDISSREFSELEFSDDIYWSIEPGEITGSNDSGEYHYKASQTLYAHTYTGEAVSATDNVLYDDFSGWQYSVAEYVAEYLYTSETARVITWSIYDEPGFDKLVTTNADGEVISNVQASGTNLGVTTKGVGYQIVRTGSVNLNFDVRWVDSSGSDIPLSLDISEPKLLPINDLIFSRASITRLAKPPEEQNTPVLLGQLTLILTGVYFTEGLDLVEIYQQTPLVHPVDAANKLKPPGKEYFDDDFPIDTVGIETDLLPSEV